MVQEGYGSVDDVVVSVLVGMDLSVDEKLGLLNHAFFDKGDQFWVYRGLRDHVSAVKKLLEGCGVDYFDDLSDDKKNAGVIRTYPEFSSTVDLVDEMWRQSSVVKPWAQTVCDLAIFHTGAYDLSEFEVEDGDRGFSLICDSSVNGVEGYGAVSRSGEVLGLFPVYTADKGPADAFRRCLRAGSDGQLTCVLNTSLGKCCDTAFGFQDQSWDPCDALRFYQEMEDHRGTFRLRLPDGLSEKPMFLRDDVKYADGYCYLKALKPSRYIAALNTMGSFPGPGVALTVLKGDPDGQRLGCALQSTSIDGLYHVVEVGGRVSLIESLQRLRVSDCLGAEGFDGSHRRADSGSCFGVSSSVEKCEFVGSSGSHMVCTSCYRKVLVQGHDLRCSRDVRGRGYCRSCDCGVVLEGHQDRCGVGVRVRDGSVVRRSLVGDAVHQCDVKFAVAVLEPDITRLTVLATEFISASGQRSYLERVEPSACGLAASDRQWATSFEARYFGDFRSRYRTWLWETLVSRMSGLHFGRLHADLLQFEGESIGGFPGLRRGSVDGFPDPSTGFPYELDLSGYAAGDYHEVCGETVPCVDGVD